MPPLFLYNNALSGHFLRLLQTEHFELGVPPVAARFYGVVPHCGNAAAHHCKNVRAQRAHLSFAAYGGKQAPALRAAFSAPQAENRPSALQLTQRLTS